MKNYFKSVDYFDNNIICGIQHKKLPLMYLIKFIKKLKKCYLKKYLTSYIRKAGYNKNHKWCYIPHFAIIIILKEIKFYKRNRRWKVINEKN